MTGPTPKPAAAPGLPTTDGAHTPGPSEPAPPPPTSRGPADRPLTPDDPAPLVAILIGAAVDIRRLGHATVDMPASDDGPRDVLTAIAEAARLRGHWNTEVVKAQAMACVWLLARHVRQDVTAWNDTPGRTEVEVYDALWDTAEEVLRDAR